MKTSMRFLAALVSFAAITSLSSSASSLLCQSGPKTLNGSGTLVTMYSCAIPANAVATDKSIRVTANLGSGANQMLSDVVLNGHETVAAAPPDGGQHWDFIIVNTESTTGTIAGLQPGASLNTVEMFGLSTVSPATLPWATGWTLEIAVDASTGDPMSGISFTVEILD